MKPNPRFLNQPQSFWANVRAVSECCGYTVRGTGQVLTPDLNTLAVACEKLGVAKGHLVLRAGRPTNLGKSLLAYFSYRAHVLNKFVEPKLMSGDEAAKAFRRIRRMTKSELPVAMNKQKGSKKKPSYLTNIVNMLIAHNIGAHPCDYDPRRLTTFTQNGVPLRTLARRVDGAFPSPVNPVAVWEIKEYYYTTTFGSRIADGVYETLLDGMELQELRRAARVDCRHYLMIDAHYTWWQCGRSYLCRIIDMLHMGYVDEVLFGAEVIDRLPALAREWVKAYRKQRVP